MSIENEIFAEFIVISDFYKMANSALISSSSRSPYSCLANCSAL